MLSAEHLGIRYGDAVIVDDVSFTLSEGQWLMVVGPNGAGKSTIVNALVNSVPHTGTIKYRGEDISKMKPRELARKMGVLTQNHFVGYSFTVREVVRLGRYAYSGGLFSGGGGDEQSVTEALQKTGMLPQAEQSVLTLSGGELQRTFLAQLFAQDPELLILDEPTNHLDIVYQKQVFSLVSEWLKTPGRAVISVVHDLSLARAYGTHAMLMNKGKLVSAGEIDKVLTRKSLEEVYSIDVYEWMRDMLSRWEE